MPDKRVSGRTHYILPKGMRYSILSERRMYYRDEFSFRRVSRWFGSRQKRAYAVVIGRHTGIFLKRFQAYVKEPIIIDEYETLDDVGEMVLRFLPEGVYYDRNRYSDLSKCSGCGNRGGGCWRCKNFLGQELAFDLDPENTVCPVHGDLEEKMRHHQGLGFCEIEFNLVKEQAAGLYDYLSRRFNELRLVYSGRGLHIHVRDEDALKMSRRERRKLARDVIKRGYGIDEWVTVGNMRLIRLPYSLHGMVSRILLPLDRRGLEGFNPVSDKRCMPGFMKARVSKKNF